MVELTRGQALSPVFMNADIIAGLAYKHMDVEPVVVQKLDEKTNIASHMIGKHQSVTYLVGTLLKRRRSHSNNGHLR